MKLIRQQSTNQGTPGALDFEDLVTIELPWKNNQRQISCIPAGCYNLELYNSPSHGEVLRVLTVPLRDGVLMHSGNYAGDVSLGFKSDSEGCIIVGSEIGILDGQTAVLASRVAMARLIAAFKAGLVGNYLMVVDAGSVVV